MPKPYHEIQIENQFLKQKDFIFQKDKSFSQKLKYLIIHFGKSIKIMNNRGVICNDLRNGESSKFYNKSERLQMKNKKINGWRYSSRIDYCQSLFIGSEAMKLRQSNQFKEYQSILYKRLQGFRQMDLFKLLQKFDEIPQQQYEYQLAGTNIHLHFQPIQYLSKLFKYRKLLLFYKEDIQRQQYIQEIKKIYCKKDVMLFGIYILWMTCPISYINILKKLHNITKTTCEISQHHHLMTLMMNNIKDKSNKQLINIKLLQLLTLNNIIQKICYLTYYQVYQSKNQFQPRNA